MEEMRCDACGGSWLTPASLDAVARKVFAASSRQGDPIGAIRLLRERTGLSLRDAKGVYYHLTKRAGECHRCGEGLAGGGTVVCGRCGSLNLDW